MSNRTLKALKVFFIKHSDRFMWNHVGDQTLESLRGRRHVCELKITGRLSTSPDFISDLWFCSSNEPEHKHSAVTM